VNIDVSTIPGSLNRVLRGGVGQQSYLLIVVANGA